MRLDVFPTRGHPPLAEITAADIDELIAMTEEHGRAAGTIRNTIAPLRMMLGNARR